MTLRNLLRASLLALVLAAPAARAGGFSTTNVQLLQGFNYDDAFVGEPKDGRRTTLTLNTFSTWEYGDSFAFADLNRDEYGVNDNSSVYLEWHPRLFVNKLLGQEGPALGVIRNWGAAFEINQAAGYYAYLAGVGFDFEAPKFWVLGLNVFYRYDKFAYNQWQISPYWTVPFTVGTVPFVFTGFVDVNGSKDAAGDDIVEIWAQPELLVDVLAPFGGKAGKLHAGVELWYHRGVAVGGTEIIDSTVPLAMVQWTIF